jgi:hypothetical protein
VSSFPWGGQAASELTAAGPVVQPAYDRDAIEAQHEAHLAALEREAFAKGFAQGELAGARCSTASPTPSAS